MSAKSFFTLLALCLIPFTDAGLKEAQNKKLINGKNLKIAFRQEYGMITSKTDFFNDSHITYHGVIASQWKMLSEMMNFSITFVEVHGSGSDGDSKEYQNQMMDLLEKKEVDAIANVVYPSADRARDFYVSTMMLSDYLVLLQLMPEIESRLFAVVKPFQPMVWLSLAMATLVVALVLFLITLATSENSNQSKLRIETTSFGFVYRLLINQGTDIASSRLTVRFITAAWGLVAVIFVYSFNGQLVSYLTVPRFEPVLNTWEDLAASPTKHIIVPKKSHFYDGLMRSSNEGFDHFRKSLEDNPNHNFKKLDDIFQLIESGCCVFPTTQIWTNQIIQYSLAMSHGECRFTIGKKMKTSSSRAALLLQKDSPYSEAIDQQLQWIFETNPDMIRDMKRMSRDVEKCSQRSLERPKLMRISLYDFSGAFFILGIGFSLSALAFLLELIWNFWKSNQVIAVVIE